jgi:hypothetical protein
MTHLTRPALSALLTCVCLALSACGGGGNESGPAEMIVASPQSVVVEAVGSCSIGLGPTVYVFGGTPPYTLRNSVPTGMVLDKSRLTNSGDGFTVTFIGGVCMNAMPISIEDEMGRLLDVSITNKTK